MKESIVDSLPEQVTDRLRLRQLALSDLPSLLKYAHNPKIADQILNIPFPYKEEDAIYRLNFVLLGFKNKKRYVFAISFKDKNELIGEIGLHLDKDSTYIYAAMYDPMAIL
jgi:ribosomal-protein-alanine N-acetyltransferase